MAGALGDLPQPDDATQETVLDRSITEGNQFRPPLSLLPTVPRSVASPRPSSRGSHYQPVDAPIVHPGLLSLDLAPSFDTRPTNPLPAPLPGAPIFVGHIGGPGVDRSSRGQSPGGAGNAVTVQSFGSLGSGAGHFFAPSSGVVAAGNPTTDPAYITGSNTRAALPTADAGDETSESSLVGDLDAEGEKRVDVDWERMAVKMAERDGKLKTNKRGEPNLEAAFGGLSDWFVKRLNDQGFGELRDQLIADFPEEKTPGEPTGGIVEGTGHGVLANASSCGGSGSGAVHLDAHKDEYGMQWNDPAYPRTVGGNVLGNDCDADSWHILTASLIPRRVHGVMTLDPDGSFIYTPDEGYLGADVFWYRASDGHGNYDTAPVNFYIYQPDIDVDSNNDYDPNPDPPDEPDPNHGIDPDNSSSGTDDKIEYDSNKPGKVMGVNDDDENGNGTPDYLAPGPVSGENDLVKAELEREKNGKRTEREKGISPINASSLSAASSPRRPASSRRAIPRSILPTSLEVTHALFRQPRVPAKRRRRVLSSEPWTRRVKSGWTSIGSGWRSRWPSGTAS